jgi:hypothetical protein
MTRRILSSKAFLAGFAFSVAASFSQVAAATWYRTVTSTAVVEVAAAELIIPFPSDGTSGTPNGNSTTGIYVDFYVVGSGTANVSARACSTSYNNSGGGCGTISTNDYNSGSSYDVSLSKWSGTSSVWDYFYVWIYTNSATGTAGVYANGIGVTGT